jgi:hypothetical protein
MKTAKHTCMSEIEGLLEDIYGYLTAETGSTRRPRVDPTIESQMDLSLDVLPPDEVKETWHFITPGLYYYGDPNA